VTRITAAARAIRHGRWRELREVIEAQIALLNAQTMRSLLPPGKFVDFNNPTRASGEDRALGLRLARAVDRASRFGVFHPMCLARAVALSNMLESRGIEAHRIRIGVRKHDGVFSAHAWVELGSDVIGDYTTAIEDYVPLTEVRVNRNRSLSSLWQNDNSQ
jgi:hypothetical protein